MSNYEAPAAPHKAAKARKPNETLRMATIVCLASVGLLPASPHRIIAATAGSAFTVVAGAPAVNPQGTQPAQPNSDFTAKLVLVHSEEEFHRWNAASPEARAKSGGTIDLHPGEKSMAFALVTGSGVSHHHLTAECMLLAPEPAEPLFDDYSKSIYANGRIFYFPEFKLHPRFQRGWEDCLVETRTNREFVNAAMLVLVLFSADHDAKSAPGTWKLSADYETKAPGTWDLQVRIRDASNGQSEFAEGQIAIVPDTSPDTSKDAREDVFGRHSAIEVIPSSKDLTWRSLPLGQTAKNAARGSAGAGAGGTGPMSRVDILALLAANESSGYLARLVRQRGIDFVVSAAFLRQLRDAGAENVLENALRLSRRLLRPGGGIAASGQDTVLESIQHASQFEKSGQYARAELEYRAILPWSNGNAALLIALGHTFLLDRKYDEAEAQFRAAVKLWPDSPVAHSDLGVALARRGSLAEAIAEQLTAIRLDMKYEDAHGHLGYDLALTGDLENGYAELQRAVRANSRWQDTFSYVRARVDQIDAALSLLNKNRADEAIAKFQDLLRQEPYFFDAHLSLGSAFMSKKQYDQAMAEAQTAVRLNPRSDEAHRLLANVLIGKEDWDQATAELRRTIQLAPDSSVAHHLLGLILWKHTEDMQSAWAELETARRLDPKDPQIEVSYQSLRKELGR